MKCKKTDSLTKMDVQMEQVEEQSNSEIINSLNADCWRLILDYLSVKELLQTEATCRDWQKLVLEHISHRPIVIHSLEIDENTLILRQSTEAWGSFKRWLRKCGRAVQDFDMDCKHYKDVVETLRDSCPNLIGLKLSRLKKKLSPTDTLHFEKLTWLVFDCCDEVTDDCVTQFLTNSLEELRITYNKRVTGRFLNNLKPKNNIKSLALKHCRALRFPFLLSIVDRLATSCKELMAVDLICNHITRRGLDALCRHVGPRLLELNLSESLLTDDDVASCVYACPKLLSLDLSDCPMLVSAVPRIAVARRDMRQNTKFANETFLKLPLPLTMSRWDFYGDADDFKDVVNVRFNSEGYSSVERQY